MIPVIIILFLNRPCVEQVRHNIPAFDNIGTGNEFPHAVQCVCVIDIIFKFDQITANVLQLPEGGDFEAINCQPSTNFGRSTKLDLTTSPPLLGRCCYV